MNTFFHYNKMFPLFFSTLIFWHKIVLPKILIAQTNYLQKKRFVLFIFWQILWFAYPEFLVTAQKKTRVGFES